MSPNVPSGKQRQAILALLRCPTIRQAAAQVHVNEKTLDRWLSDPTFAAALQLAQRQAFRRALGQLQASLEHAIETLRDALTASPPAPPTRIRAAVALIDAALRAHSAIELEERVQRLEAADEGRPAPRPSWEANGDSA